MFVHVKNSNKLQMYDKSVSPRFRSIYIVCDNLHYNYTTYNVTANYTCFQIVENVLSIVSLARVRLRIRKLAQRQNSPSSRSFI